MQLSLGRVAGFEPVDHAVFQKLILGHDAELFGLRETGSYYNRDWPAEYTYKRMLETCAKWVIPFLMRPDIVKAIGRIYEELCLLVSDPAKMHPVVPYRALMKTESDLRDLRSCEWPSVCILGQDPYPNRAHATGFAFLSPTDASIPASLRKIHASMAKSTGMEQSARNMLRDMWLWPSQNVLLLNTSLVFISNDYTAQLIELWKPFMDPLISYNSANSHCAFMLWGEPAKAKKPLIDTTMSAIFEAYHPSPLCQYPFEPRFAQVNEWLASKGKKQILWTQPIIE